MSLFIRYLPTTFAGGGGPGGGVNQIGTIDSQTAAANGAVIVGTALYMQSASTTVPGLVNITTQTFAGQKTFSTGLTGTLTGHATLDVATSSLGNLTDAGTDGIVVTGGTGAVVGTVSLAQHVADTTHNGYLSSTDWNTFNSKQATVSIGSFSNTSTANGLDITANVLTLHAADGTNPGAMTTGTQTLAGAKTFSTSLTSPVITATNAAGSIRFQAGTNPTDNGLTLTGGGTLWGAYNVSDDANGNSNGAFQSVTHSDTASSNAMNFAKSRGTFASQAVVQSSDGLGSLLFYGYDGAGYVIGASIAAAVSGTPGSASMPGSLVFATTASGAASSTTALTIGSSQNATFTGTVTSSKSPAASSAAFAATGAPFTGGSATTTKPLVHLANAATSNNWSTSGTILGINPATGFAGNLIDCQLNAAARFSVTSAGAGTFASTIAASNFSGTSSGTNTGDVTLASFGSTPATEGASLSGQVLTLQPADATHGGGVSTTTQTFAGVKTFSSAPNLSSLSASLPLKLDGSKNITAAAIALGGSEVTGTLGLTNGGSGNTTGQPTCSQATSFTSSVKTPGASGRYLAMTTNSMSLTAGTWMLLGVSHFGNSGSPSYTETQVGWYGANGADNGSEPALLSTLGTVQGIYYADMQVSSQAIDIVAPSTLVTLSSTQTIYLVPFCSQGTSSAARVTCYGWAVKISAT